MKRFARQPFQRERQHPAPVPGRAGSGGKGEPEMPAEAASGDLSEYSEQCGGADRTGLRQNARGRAAERGLGGGRMIQKDYVLPEIRADPGERR